jgi:hypothetical protein
MVHRHDPRHLHPGAGAGAHDEGFSVDFRRMPKEDDDVVPFAHRDLHAAALPRSITRTTSGGHQLGDDLRMIAADIRATV